MTNKQYQDMVEEKYNKPLKEVMYDLCVKRQLLPVEGASILGVPKKTFLAWRAKFEFGPLQIQSNYAKEIRDRQIKHYKEQLHTIDLTRPFALSDDQSLIGFREVLVRYLELYKAKRTVEVDSLGEMTTIMKIACYQEILSYFDAYIEGSLYEKFVQEAELIKRQIEDEKDQVNL